MFKVNRKLKKAQKNRIPHPIPPPQPQKQDLTPIYLIGGVIILVYYLENEILKLSGKGF